MESISKCHHFFTAEMTTEGSCFCGSVRFETSASPAFEGYCHCKDCSKYHSASPLAFVVFPKGTVKFTKGEEHVGVFRKVGGSEKLNNRYFCKNCGSPLKNQNDLLGVDVTFLSALENFQFKPVSHVNYENKVNFVKFH
jgi:hypothetical protein